MKFGPEVLEEKSFKRVDRRRTDGTERQYETFV